MSLVLEWCMQNYQQPIEFERAVVEIRDARKQPSVVLRPNFAILRGTVIEPSGLACLLSEAVWGVTQSGSSSVSFLSLAIEGKRLQFQSFAVVAYATSSDKIIAIDRHRSCTAGHMLKRDCAQYRVAKQSKCG